MTCLVQPSVELIDYLDSWSVKRGEATQEDRLANAAAKFAYEHLGRDSDGQFILDYLNPKFRETWTKADALQKMRRPVSQFVSKEIGRFRRERNRKLLDRYLMLRNYLRSGGCWEEPLEQPSSLITKWMRVFRQNPR